VSSPTERVRAPLAPASIVVGLLTALCALLLLKWLAVVALAALALGALVWWARRDPTRPAPTVRRREVDPEPAWEPEPAPVARVATDDDCSWCGLPGGHRDLHGRLVRPRHVHQVR
jgi:hypothetical protein